jgi:hypothetical protein
MMPLLRLPNVAHPMKQFNLVALEEIGWPMAIAHVCNFDVKNYIKQEEEKKQENKPDETIVASFLYSLDPRRWHDDKYCQIDEDTKCRVHSRKTAKFLHLKGLDDAKLER